MSNEDAIKQAAAAIQEADALLITAGAGMGVDSGLPDFRGTEGFWQAYPPFAERGLSFHEVADPRWFDEDPALAWGFYGHRYNLYRATPPHAGFGILQKWAVNKALGAFVFTSNVDNHFQKSGFESERVLEVHGSILHLQCSVPCREEVWEAGDLQVAIDESNFEADEPLPRCPHCGALARPNILMFRDGQWLWKRMEEQEVRLQAWLQSLAGHSMAIIECGAGAAIPTVRRFSEKMQEFGGTLIRINPREADGPEGCISIESGAGHALREIDALID